MFLIPCCLVCTHMSPKKNPFQPKKLINIDFTFFIVSILMSHALLDIIDGVWCCQSHLLRVPSNVVLNVNTLYFRALLNLVEIFDCSWTIYFVQKSRHFCKGRVSRLWIPLFRVEIINNRFTALCWFLVLLLRDCHFGINFPNGGEHVSGDDQLICKYHQ